MSIKRSSKRKDPAEKISRLLAAVEEKLSSEVKCSVGDYIRLLQAQQEFDRETPRDIEVTWVESIEPKNESDK